MTNSLRVSGVAPSRFKTKYERSKPVAMPRLTIDEDMIAMARIPGVKN